MSSVIDGTDNFDTGVNSRSAIVDFGTVTVNSRYVEVNPFGNINYEKCIVRLQLWDATNSKWFTVGGGSQDGSAAYGILADSMAEGIVVQTALSNLHVGASTGSLHTSTISSQTSASCRVIVFYIGGTI